MKKYRGYYIDHIYFHTEADVDKWILEQAIHRYESAVRQFVKKSSMEASIYCDNAAQFLHNQGMDWPEIEALEIKTMESMAA